MRKFLLIGMASCALAGAAVAQTDSFNNNSGNFCSAIGNNASVVCELSGRLEFTDQIGDALAHHMPDKAKLVDLYTVGGDRDQAVGNQVQTYLTTHGYKIARRLQIGMKIPPPDHPLTLQTDNAQYHLTVAPSAR
jgi:hypothetical protein